MQTDSFFRSTGCVDLVSHKEASNRSSSSLYTNRECYRKPPMTDSHSSCLGAYSTEFQRVCLQKAELGFSVVFGPKDLCNCKITKKFITLQFNVILIFLDKRSL